MPAPVIVYETRMLTRVNRKASLADNFVNEHESLSKSSSTYIRVPQIIIRHHDIAIILRLRTNFIRGSARLTLVEVA